MRGTHLLIAIALLFTGAAGCGDDGGSSAPKKAAAAKAKPKDKVKPKKLEVISYIQTLEKVVPATESGTIRRRLKDRDFQTDLTGTENRNPFQSFTLPQVGPAEPLLPSGPPPPPKPTDLCARNKIKASTYALKDLELIGIVRRGSQYFAQFRDKAGVGHQVERGMCLGREKALVTVIGEGLVTLELVPEAIQGGPEPTPVTRTIPLYASELTADDFDSEETPAEPTEGDSTETAPPPTMEPENPTPGPSATPPAGGNGM